MSILYLNLGTADADRIWDYGPGFVRLAGVGVGGSEVVTTTDIRSVVEMILQADLVVGHDLLAFGLPALERYHGLDLARLVRERRVMDTLLAARQNDPPLSGKADARRYNLAALCRRVLGAAKVPDDSESMLRVLARQFGGYDRIPVGHPEYVRYLVRDVELVRELAQYLAVDEYIWREHEVMWRLGHISKQGWRVDADRVQAVLMAQEERVSLHKERLHHVYGLPLEGAKPQATSAGKEALIQAFTDLGVRPPRTPKGNLATGKDTLEALEAEHPDNTGLLELCSVLRASNGERSSAQTIFQHTGPDGRVHPRVTASQAFGRFSVTKPGLTVQGKRDRGNLLERSLLLPDEGHVLITADLAQIDARAIAMHAQDPGYIAAVAPGADLHDEMAAAVFGEDGWGRGAGHHPRRGDAKAITHATSYGMGATGLAAYAGIPVDEAQRQLATLDAQFPRLATFKSAIRNQARGQILVNAYGRRMRVHPGREYTQGPAAMGQGTARDLMTEGILRLPEWLLPCLRAIIHDELVLSVPENRVEEAENAVLNALQFSHQVAPGATPVPVLAAKGARGRDWADCYRREKPGWPEVARDHRELITCSDRRCSWHTADNITDTNTEEIPA
ncbi:DNA polymerase [Arthrobacter sp. zg-Y1171]|uniref:DNA polymerase n=1 Tax=Arthrobacter sp. zg-Y1171 TaxID=2964610 RepID=UPI002105E9CD|nr:DNA polymerase [Arthrobacter sp. zg-Y1171]MCQ1994525.1 DNA polymerase [Arthrobacter sp. zg-Y1171]UWX81393.1 DNA polymerase [Arthrobacter sp. zg-Y1171]